MKLEVGGGEKPDNNLFFIFMMEELYLVPHYIFYT